MTELWLADANVLLDIFTNDAVWAKWSAARLAETSADGIANNPIIYAELRPAFVSEKELLIALSEWPMKYLPLPIECAWLAAEAHSRYRRRGGTRKSTLPDFFIGAHAQITGMGVLSRDPGHYRTYFPQVALRTPE